MNFDKVIDSRRSIRSFKTKKVKYSKVLEAIDAARKAPTAGNTPTLVYIIIENPQLKDKIAELSDQHWIADAGIIVLVCSDDHALESIYFDRGKTYARQQAGAAIQNFLLKITDLSLSSCWVGSFSDKLIKQIVGIPNHIQLEAILPVGYAAEKPRFPKKGSLEKSLYWEKWFIRKRPTPFKDPPTK
ncbi:hypothetical protein COU62_00765 [Candidatus Pacearchaeota archaeon CG10_big_fil_rev_8_21_14_0_10_35_219]|nr:hypothetical protein [Candidatus Pacearchaeota archaeon]OIO42750.1 MAG: hypothetical protein AUJ63_01905 [Candidatus Pacearchaeota archaeon CG1_02_35_32]PIO08217.1 MAG: hypothetical protein COU62_00765 [Candidatus Pacearchaeota archaeon CG10_big_fil_rev_8_21_14_0_10_35_219]PIY81727.1 MAG: hypothetical protein COY79_01060 [Candidatus Pacearchaeota archaeon CG_4_10_14_0_8_um_filter_35_169]PIZ80369.1 MAG: hypothetical protein COY00_01435 [Candidatus Pacearchaeota archaeon CG_4_10_14_0_2_um_filt